MTTKNKATDLRRCPFCGSKAEIAFQCRNSIYIHCPCCGTTGPTASKEAGKETAVELWNKRAKRV